ncbi:hypothetical protein J2S43_000971 [Catenuloplanes nepalensis]|uniref:Uncharacterized protein n=1 Tax=Catenuloplanes nepalensis TaxID=587533 RepID=A0ABT9MM09_9ACTN|nr:hypothetical protein [Catenuloplanes nepalensis]MDP9792459.1 hypothetical protein [Catenuloplanes nepalensis]
MPGYLVGDAVTAYLAAMHRCDAARMPILLPTPTINPHIDLYVAAVAATAHDLHSSAGDDRLGQAIVYLRRTDRSVDPARWEPDQQHTAVNTLTEILGAALAREVRRRPAGDRLRRYALCAAYDAATSDDGGPAHAQLARIGGLLRAAGNADRLWAIRSQCRSAVRARSVPRALSVGGRGSPPGRSWRACSTGTSPCRSEPRVNRTGANHLGRSASAGISRQPGRSKPASDLACGRAHRLTRPRRCIRSERYGCGRRAGARFAGTGAA